MKRISERSSTTHRPWDRLPGNVNEVGEGEKLVLAPNLAETSSTGRPAGIIFINSSIQLIHFKVVLEYALLLADFSRSGVLTLPPCPLLLSHCRSALIAGRLIGQAGRQASIYYFSLRLIVELVPPVAVPVTRQQEKTLYGNFQCTCVPNALREWRTKSLPRPSTSCLQMTTTHGIPRRGSMLMPVHSNNCLSIRIIWDLGVTCSMLRWRSTMASGV